MTNTSASSVDYKIDTELEDLLYFHDSVTPGGATLLTGTLAANSSTPFGLYCSDDIYQVTDPLSLTFSGFRVFNMTTGLQELSQNTSITIDYTENKASPECLSVTPNETFEITGEIGGTISSLTKEHTLTNLRGTPLNYRINVPAAQASDVTFRDATHPTGVPALTGTLAAGASLIFQTDVATPTTAITRSFPIQVSVPGEIPALKTSRTVHENIVPSNGDYLLSHWEVLQNSPNTFNYLHSKGNITTYPGNETIVIPQPSVDYEANFEFKIEPTAGKNKAECRILLNATGESNSLTSKLYLKLNCPSDETVTLSQPHLCPIELWYVDSAGQHHKQNQNMQDESKQSDVTLESITEASYPGNTKTIIAGVWHEIHIQVTKLNTTSTLVRAWFRKRNLVVNGAETNEPSSDLWNRIYYVNQDDKEHSPYLIPSPVDYSLTSANYSASSSGYFGISPCYPDASYCTWSFKNPTLVKLSEIKLSQN